MNDTCSATKIMATMLNKQGRVKGS